jgi:hypothetical protein
MQRNRLTRAHSQLNPDKANLGARLLMIFVGLATPLTLVLWFFLPETRNRSLEEVDAIFGAPRAGVEKKAESV